MFERENEEMLKYVTSETTNLIKLTIYISMIIE
jgi:hypothetical protein